MAALFWPLMALGSPSPACLLWALDRGFWRSPCAIFLFVTIAIFLGRRCLVTLRFFATFPVLALLPSFLFLAIRRTRYRWFQGNRYRELCSGDNELKVCGKNCIIHCLLSSDALSKQIIFSFSQPPSSQTRGLAQWKTSILRLVAPRHP